MTKKYVHNDTAGPIWAGGKLIPAGEGREVDVPDEHEAKASADATGSDADTDAPLRELLAGNVGAVKAGLDGLSAETLKRLQDLEAAAEKPRKGVLEALADAQIALADKKLQSNDLGDGTGGGNPEGGQGGPGGAGNDTPPAE